MSKKFYFSKTKDISLPKKRGDTQRIETIRKIPKFRQ